MKWSFKIARLFGIDIRVHLIFLLVPAYAAVRAGAEGAATAFWSAVYTLLAFACVLLHELGHSLVALRHGIEVRDITLLPIGGVARLGEVPEDPSTELKISIAGPLVNVGLVAVMLPPFFLAVAGGHLISGEATGGLANLLFVLILINAVMAAFNILPAFPMDGGRILRSTLARFMPHVRATHVAVVVARVVAALMFVAGLLLGSPWLAIIAVFVLFAGAQEERMVQMRHAGRVVFGPPPAPEIIIEAPPSASSPDLEAAEAFADLARRLEAIRRRAAEP